MGLEITRSKDGSPRSKWWYGNFTVDGERKYVNLGIEICGQVPASLKEAGDVAYERSRMKAQLKLDALKQDAHSRKSAVHHLQELYRCNGSLRCTAIHCGFISRLGRPASASSGSSGF